jgi:hypothetical protein
MTNSAAQNKNRSHETAVGFGPGSVVTFCSGCASSKAGFGTNTVVYGPAEASSGIVTEVMLPEEGNIAFREMALARVALEKSDAKPAPPNRMGFQHASQNHEIAQGVADGDATNKPHSIHVNEPGPEVLVEQDVAAFKVAMKEAAVVQVRNQVRQAHDDLSRVQASVAHPRRERLCSRNFLTDGIGGEWPAEPPHIGRGEHAWRGHIGLFEEQSAKKGAPRARLAKEVFELVPKSPVIHTTDHEPAAGGALYPGDRDIRGILKILSRILQIPLDGRTDLIHVCPCPAANCPTQIPRVETNNVVLARTDEGAS